MVAVAQKASLTAKCLYELQMPFLLVFCSFQSHGLVQHPSMHCRPLAIARGYLGDICGPVGLDYWEQGVSERCAFLSHLANYTRVFKGFTPFETTV